MNKLYEYIKANEKMVTDDIITALNKLECEDPYVGVDSNSKMNISNDIFKLFLNWCK